MPRGWLQQQLIEEKESRETVGRPIEKRGEVEDQEHREHQEHKSKREND